MSAVIPAPAALSWEKKVLKFLRPARTSYTVFEERPVWYVSVSNPGVKWSGVGECAPLAGLSIEPLSDIEPMLERIRRDTPRFLMSDSDELRRFPSIRFALEAALLHYYAGGGNVIFGSDFTEKKRSIPVNGLVWMGDRDFMKEQIDRKIAEGYRCIKLKIGGLEFESELELLRYIRSKYAAKNLEIRLDANGAFSAETAYDRLCALVPFVIHSIEQPIRPGQQEAMADLCRRSPIPIALDEELITAVASNAYRELIERVKPAYVILKPSLLGGFQQCEAVIESAGKNGVGFWITSALESNYALNYIAQWAAAVSPPDVVQGLGTGQLFSNNVPSVLSVSNGQMHFTGE